MELEELAKPKNARNMRAILRGETTFTEFYKADAILTKMDLNYQLGYLRIYDDKEKHKILKTQGHGIARYRKGCRCLVCRNSNRDRRRKHRANQRARLAAKAA